MYKTVLPQTGMIGLGVAGISTQNSIIIGVSLVVMGVLLFKLLKFKIKDSKK
jgi:hypothetical protein